MNLSLTAEQVEALLATLFESRSGLPVSVPSTGFRNAVSLSRQPGLDFASRGAGGYDPSTAYHQNRDGGAQQRSLPHHESEMMITPRPADSEATTNDHLVNESPEMDKKFVRKRPGPKPSTREPATKRRAQNRAAQRAYRERKETHIKDLEEANESLRVLLESEKKENSALRAELLKMGLVMRARNETAVPSSRSDLSICCSSAKVDVGGNTETSSASTTSPISPEIPHEPNRMSSTATSENSQAMSSSWVPKPSHDYQNSSSHTTHRLHYPFPPDSRSSAAPLAVSDHTQYGESYFNMVNSAGNSNLYAMGTHESPARVEPEMDSSSGYRPADSSRGTSIVSLNMPPGASRPHWGPNSGFNAPAEAARYSPGIYLHQFQSAGHNQGGNPFGHMNSNSGTTPIIMENPADWYFGHQGVLIDEAMFTEYRGTEESMEFGDDFYESNQSENSGDKKSRFSTSVAEAERNESMGMRKDSKKSVEFKLVVNASRQIWNTLWSNWHMAESNNNHPVLDGLCRQLEARARC